MRAFQPLSICLAVALAGCGQTSTDGAANAAQAPVKKDGGYLVTQAEFAAAGKTWPLTVPEAVIGCTPLGALWVLTDDQKFGLNDWASQAEGYANLQEIQKPDQKAMDEAKKAAEEKAKKAAARNKPAEKKRGRGKPQGPPTIYLSAEDLVASARSKCRR